MISYKFHEPLCEPRVSENCASCGQRAACGLKVPTARLREEESPTSKQARPIVVAGNVWKQHFVDIC